MAFSHGRLAVFKLGATDLSAFMDNIDFPHEADDHETTTYGKTYKTRAGGLKDASFDIGGLFDSGVAGPETIIPPLIGTISTFTYQPEGTGAGKTQYTGSCLVKSYNQSTPVADMVRWTATLMTSDTVTKAAQV